MKRRKPTDFDLWLSEAFADHGAFTALVVLVRISEPQVTPVVSTFLTVVGDEVSWKEMAGLFGGSGRPWDGAVFFPQTEDGPLENAEARGRLRALEQRIRENRLVINEGEFFDTLGRRLKVEEVQRN